MVDVLYRQIELIFVAMVSPAIFGPLVGQHALQGDGVLLIERVIRSLRRLAAVRERRD
jgi:hypothetical protein